MVLFLFHLQALAWNTVDDSIPHILCGVLDPSNFFEIEKHAVSSLAVLLDSHWGAPCLTAQPARRQHFSLSPSLRQHIARQDKVVLHAFCSQGTAAFVNGTCDLPSLVNMKYKCASSADLWPCPWDGLVGEK